MMTILISVDHDGDDHLKKGKNVLDKFQVSLDGFLFDYR